MHSSRRALGALASAALLCLAVAAAGDADAQAVLYRYVDANGGIHFTDTPADARWAKVSIRKPMGPAIEKASARHFEGVIQRTARLHGLPPNLVKAVIRAESNFDPTARSHKGAMGLMQLMPGTAEAMGVDDPWQAEENVRGGTRYLRSMVNRYGDYRLALAAYNAGPRAVDQYGGVPPYQETQEYVRRVLAYYRKYDGNPRR
ncbi:MAG: lytic transglycosylase domain-containing protein [Deltaproteobacteria bacterium]|nr:lytic transglycosylase domain-containing protein [Deltaproteobacteria bacterium]